MESEQLQKDHCGKDKEYEAFRFLECEQGSLTGKKGWLKFKNKEIIREIHCLKRFQIRGNITFTQFRFFGCACEMRSLTLTKSFPVYLGKRTNVQRAVPSQDTNWKLLTEAVLKTDQ